jgi:hypothetical protein
MKKMTCGILVVLVAFATSVVYGGQPAAGVAGVDVFVKQMPKKRTVTDARGNFALDGLAPGSYTLTFRSAKAKNTKTEKITDKVIVATSYSIKIDGTQKSVNQSGLTNDKLLAGVEIPVAVGAGAKVRGQVAAGALKKMVWIPKKIGSNIAGHWAEEGTEAAGNTETYTRESMQDAMSRWSPNRTDPLIPANNLPGAPR